MGRSESARMGGGAGLDLAGVRATQHTHTHTTRSDNAQTDNTQQTTHDKTTNTKHTQTQYPTEDEYSKFISDRGGHTNAFTSAEDTVYHFDANAGALPEALDRFAQFFIAPLISGALSWWFCLGLVCLLVW